MSVITQFERLCILSKFKRIRKMVSFKLSKEIEKGVICPAPVTRHKNIIIFLYPNLFAFKMKFSHMIFTLTSIFSGML